MTSLQHTSKPTSPVELNGVSTAKVELGRIQSITIQAALFSNSDNLVHFRITDEPAADPTTLANAENCIGHLETREVPCSIHRNMYLYVLVTDLAGVTQEGGTDDRVTLLEVA